MDQELPTLLEQMSSPLFSVRFDLSNLKFSVFCFCRPLSFWTFCFDYCIVCSLIYVFWLPLWYLLVIVLSVLWFKSSGYPFGICWSLYCLFFDLCLLVTHLVSFGHCIVCSLIYVFWLPIWYLLVIVLSVLRFTSSGYHYCIFQIVLLWLIHFCVLMQLRQSMKTLLLSLSATFKQHSSLFSFYFIRNMSNANVYFSLSKTYHIIFKYILENKL
jgi:hypothetical protein